MNILGLIPARGGSKGIPGKNAKLLHGKPLINFTIESGLASPLIDRLVVSTDDEKIANLSKAAGAEVPFLRPANLATDKSPTIDMVIHALQFYKDINVHFHAVCLLQPTVPFRVAKNLQAAIEKFIKSDVDSLITVREVPHIYNPYWTFEEDKASGFLKTAVGGGLQIKRRQDLPKAFHRDGSIYLAKSAVILEQQSLYGSKIIHHLMADSPNINIDTIEDWLAAEAFITTHPDWNNNK